MENSIGKAIIFLGISLMVVVYTIRESIPLLVDIGDVRVTLGYAAILLGSLLIYSFAAAVVWDDAVAKEEPDESEYDDLL